jgi:hypothetical protein
MQNLFAEEPSFRAVVLGELNTSDPGGREGSLFFHHRIQTGSGAHPASYPMGTEGEVFSRV